MAIDQITIEANGLRFQALSAGSGPLALCLHGFPDTAHTWRHLMPELAAAGYHAVAPWTRGYAPTATADDYSINSLAADANALHDALGGDSEAVLIGHDWGAMSSYAAASEPGRWRRVVAMSVPPPATSSQAFLTYDQLKRSFYVMLFQTTLAEFVAGADDLNFIERLWADWSPSYDAGEDLPHVKDALRSPENLAAAIGYYRAMFDSGVPMSLPTVPTLYLHGECDGAFGVEGTQGAEDELPEGSRVLRMADAGHFVHLDKPAEVNKLVLDWISS